MRQRVWSWLVASPLIALVVNVDRAAPATLSAGAVSRAAACKVLTGAYVGFGCAELPIAVDSNSLNRGTGSIHHDQDIGDGATQARSPWV